MNLIERIFRPLGGWRPSKEPPLVFDKFGIIERHLEGKDVLDCGCVGDTPGEVEMYKRISNAANYCLGLDTQEREIRKLEEDGYDVVCADAAITKTVAPVQTIPGGVVTYTLDYANQGLADAANVSISDSLDTGLSFGGVVSGPDPLSTATQPITWDLGTLTGLASGSIAFTATVEGDVACGTPLTNVATITTRRQRPPWTTTSVPPFLP